MSATTSLAPDTFAQAAAALRAASAAGQRVRIVGGATKRRWGRPHAPYDLELHTEGLDSILAHNAGDMTATLQAGVTLAAAQDAFAQAGQMLSIDPPLAGAGEDAVGGGHGATIGGIVATADSGPLAHRYGGPRDLIVGATVALADGTVAKSGGTVIKNVAGYDIAKLMAGSFGTLGLILSVNVRLHPLPERERHRRRLHRRRPDAANGGAARWRRRRPSSTRSTSAGATAAAGCWRGSPDRAASRAGGGWPISCAAPGCRRSSC